jgi:hypothetical protein
MPGLCTGSIAPLLMADRLPALRDGNLYSLIVRESRFGRNVKWRSGLRKFLEEKLFPNLTFIDVALTASICLGIPAPLNRLKESLETLKNLGIISENLKPLPYATHITRLFKGYMTKTKLVRNPRDRTEWENMLGWRTSTKTADKRLFQTHVISNTM